MLVATLAFLVAQTGGQLPDPVRYSAPLVKLLQAEWPRNRTITIVCHGHSVPAGYFKTPVVQSLDAYPHLLYGAIKRKFAFAVVNVIVTAIGGENSESGTERFERDVISLRPDVVTIDYGLNDRGIGLQRARIAWQKMIATAKEYGAMVVLLTPSWDTGGQPDEPSDPLVQHANQIKALAEENEIGLADSFSAFLQLKGKRNDFMSQPNHPNRAGHELILKELLPWFGVS